MKVFIITLWLVCSAFLPGFSEPVVSPVEPTAPQVNDTVLPDVTPPDYLKPAESRSLYMLKGWLTFSHGSFSEGVLEFSNTIQLTVTNYAQGNMTVNTLPLYDVENIMITAWKGIKTNDDYYCFLPEEYRIYTNTGTTNYMTYRGNIPSLNVMTWSTEMGRETCFSVYFDRWIAGKKGNYRWENSRALDFNYNQKNPLPKVVVGIRFDRNY